MTAAYNLSAAVWPPLIAAIFLAGFAVFCWRRRDVPGALPLAAGLLFAALWLVGIALEAAASDLSTKLRWFQFQALWQLPAATASTCFALEYTQPGRWLTRRTLYLLATPPALLALVVLVAPGLVWNPMPAPSGGVTIDYTGLGVVVMAYGVVLLAVNTVAFLWLFARSPQHRWPVVVLLAGQFVSRGLYFVNLGQPFWTDAWLDLRVVMLLVPWATDIIALFAFRIFDPVPAARTSALEQMRDAVVVFDLNWRVAGLNRAATRIAGGRGKGRTLSEWARALPEYGTQAQAEVTLGTGNQARQYEVGLTPLADFRGVQIGRLLMLRDVTDERVARSRIVEQERTLAMQAERERLARELHDGVAQGLTAVYLQASAAKVLVDRGELEEASECLNDLTEIAQQAQADVREYLMGAKAIMAAKGDFFAALREYLDRYSRQYNLPVELIEPPEDQTLGLTPEAEGQLLRIIQESLSNVRKHAGAASAQVVFGQVGGRLRVSIRDDGQGFDPRTVTTRDGYGLHSMRDRAQAMGATLEVSSTPGGGTEVAVVFGEQG